MSHTKHRTDFVFIAIALIHHLQNVNEAATGHYVHFNTFCCMEKFVVETCHVINAPGNDCYFFLHHDQVCCVEFDRKDINMNKLVATSLEGKFHVFDMRTQHPTKGFASVSEKVIDLGEASQMDVWLPRMEKCQVIIIIIIIISYICMVQREMGAHVVLTVFTAGSVWGCVCLTFLCGFVTPAKNDTGPERREKCSFLWENARKTHLSWH